MTSTVPATLGRKQEAQDQGPGLLETGAKKGRRWAFRTLRIPWLFHYPLGTDHSGGCTETNSKEGPKPETAEEVCRSQAEVLHPLGSQPFPHACSSGLTSRPGVKGQGFCPLLEAKPLPRPGAKEARTMLFMERLGERELSRGKRSFLAQICLEKVKDEECSVICKTAAHLFHKYLL